MRAWFNMMRGVAWYLLTWPWQRRAEKRRMTFTGTQRAAGGYEESWLKRPK